GHVLGALCAIDTRPRRWTRRDVAILEDTVQWVSEEMALRRQLARAEASSRHLAHLHHSLRRTQAAATHSAKATIHDLRSPLTALGIGLDQLAHIVQEQPVTRLIDTLHRNLDYIGSLVDAAADEMGVGPVRVIDAARVAADVSDHVSVPEGVELRLSVSTEPAPVRFGRVLLRRCIVNLLDNALRFARRTVHLAQHPEGDEIVTQVDDDGPGMPELADYARVGEPHLRLHAQEGYSGSGLGLSIASRLLAEHGGRLRGEPSPFGGARFEIRLPRASEGPLS
ncbi:MAG: HAMP domain-containing sensor histidine kinase, partial [Myxococcota bacterium]